MRRRHRHRRSRHVGPRSNPWAGAQCRILKATRLGRRHVPPALAPYSEADAIMQI